MYRCKQLAPLPDRIKRFVLVGERGREGRGGGGGGPPLRGVALLVTIGWKAFRNEHPHLAALLSGCQDRTGH